MKKVILHIGLHKTGTKFFQHKVFPNLPDSYVYNPPLLTQYVTDLCRCEDDEIAMVISGIENELTKISPKKTLVISREIMSGDHFSFYNRSSCEIVNRLGVIFPSGKILLSLRYQPDWLVSCYREYIHAHNYRDIGYFLGVKEGKNNELRPYKFSDLDYGEIIERFIDCFGKQNLNILFFEDLKSDKFQAVKFISQLLETSDIPITRDNDQQPNKGYSALSVRLSILRAIFFRLIGLEKYFVHRPIDFFGKNGIPSGTEHMSLLPKDPYWNKSFLRDNEEVRSRNYPNLSTFEKIKREFTWRHFVKERFDKLVYLDWDLMTKYRSDLERTFLKKNLALKKAHPELLSRMPKKYYVKGPKTLTYGQK